MFSLTTKSKEEVAVVFDIGSGSIGVSLVQFAHSQPPVTLFTNRQPLTFVSNIDSKRLMDTMVSLLKNVGQHLMRDGIPHIHHTFLGNYVIKDVFCIFSSPWYVSQTKVVKFEKEKPFLITKQFIDELVQAEEKQFKSALKDGEYEHMFTGDTRLLEKKIIHTKLNGYEVQNPIGKKAQDIELTFFTSFISNEIIRQVESVLHNLIHFRNIQYFSYALASWSAVQDMFPDNNRFLFIDISGEMTDISLTHQGVLTETISFPSGRNMLLRKISEKLNVPPEVALSYVVMHGQGATDQKLKADIEKTAKEALEEWHATFLTTTKTLMKQYVVPKKVFVTVDSDVSSYFVDALKASLPLEFTVSQNQFDVVYLNNEKVHLFTQVAPKVIPDPFLGLESIFLQKIIAL